MRAWLMKCLCLWALEAVNWLGGKYLTPEMGRQARKWVEAKVIAKLQKFADTSKAKLGITIDNQFVLFLQAFLKSNQINQEMEKART